jgi:hypothetical protein
MPRQGVKSKQFCQPALFGVFLSDSEPRDWRDLLTMGDWEMMVTIYGTMIEQGMIPEAAGFEPYFLCADQCLYSAIDSYKRPSKLGGCMKALLPASTHPHSNI